MKHVIIGASAAGLAAAQELRRLDETSEILVISRDDVIVSRCMLHKRLGGTRSEASLSFVEEDFFEKNRITWMKGREVLKISDMENSLKLDQGEKLVYDRLLIASGAESLIPPIANLRYADNVLSFRNLEDVEKIHQAVERFGKRVIIIGGGLVAMDVACGLCGKGLEVTVIEMENRIMPLQLDEFVSEQYRLAFEAAGCRIILGKQVKNSEVDEMECVRSVILSSGECLECDVIIAAVSVKPQMDFIEGTGIEGVHMNYHIQTVVSRYLKNTDIHINKGLEVDSYLKTNMADIYAAGDVTGISSIWPDARMMGICAARNMCGMQEAYKDLFPNKNAASFFGVLSVSLGKINVNTGLYEIQVHRSRTGYKRLVLKDGYLAGALLEGDISNAGVYLHLIRNQIPIEPWKSRLHQLSFADFYDITKDTGEYVYHI